MWGANGCRSCSIPLRHTLLRSCGRCFAIKTYILMSKLPLADPDLMQEDVITIVVQVNGKLRGHRGAESSRRAKSIRCRTRQREDPAFGRRKADCDDDLCTGKAC